LINQDYVTKLQSNIDKTYRILNYTRIKPRSRPPHKKSAYFTHPRFFSGQNRIKKCANYARKYGISWKHVPSESSRFVWTYKQTDEQTSRH